MLTKIYYTLWFPISISFTFIRKLKGEIFHLSSGKKTCSENDGHKLLMEPHPYPCYKHRYQLTITSQHNHLYILILRKSAVSKAKIDTTLRIAASRRRMNVYAYETCFNKKKHEYKGQRGRDEVAGLLKEFLMKTDIIVLFKFFKTSRV